MRELVIHIGSHKTGTSSIQMALMNNRESLLKHGFSFFYHAPNGKPTRNGNASWWLNVDANSLLNGDGAQIRNVSRFASVLSNGTENKIVSAEAFSWVFCDKPLIELKKHLSAEFDRTKIVIYLRRQDRLVASHCNQAFKKPNGATYQFYSPGRNALPQLKSHHFRYLNFLDKISMWDSVFGQENVDVRVFDDIERNDVVDDFFSQLGVSLGCTMSALNLSLDIERIKIMQVASAMTLDPNFVYLLQKQPHSGNKFLPTQEEARTFLEHFSESNAQLNNLRKITSRDKLFDADFSGYPECNRDFSDHDASDHYVKYLLNVFDLILKDNQTRLLRAATLLKEKGGGEYDEIFNFLERVRPFDKRLRGRSPDQLN